MKKLLFSKDYLTITFNNKKQILTATWIGLASRDEFKDGIDFMVDFTKKNQVRFVITDIRNQAVVEQESTNYAAASVNRVMENGVENLLFIVPENLFTQMSLDMYQEKLQDKVNFVQYFSNERDAIACINALIETNKHNKL